MTSIAASGSSAARDALVSVSIVSHRQGALAAALLGDLARCGTAVEVLLTLNVEETLPFAAEDFGFPLRLLRNATAKGFGANHNAAFRRAASRYFAVLNPDVRFEDDPFPPLIAALDDERLGVAAPLVLSPEGAIENSARRFPTVPRLIRHALRGGRSHDYAIGAKPLSPDWVAGMFMLFRRDVFERAGGFDERYFLYYEDVDLCARLRRMGFDVRLVPSARVVHDARRASHRDPRRMLRHLASMVRFLVSRERISRRRSAIEH